MTSLPNDIVSFWRDAGPKKWFRKSDAFDAQIKATFLNDVLAARDGTYDAWIDEAFPCLALLILLDQFPRNIFRGSPDMFASDAKAVNVAKMAVDHGHDRVIDTDMRAFVYMPFMHSENHEEQSLSIALFEAMGAPDNIKHAIEHAEIIEKFGKFPHRNAVLERTSTPAEADFLADGGFFGLTRTLGDPLITFSTFLQMAFNLHSVTQTSSQLADT